MSEKFDNMLERQNANCGAFDCFVTNFEKCPKENLTVGYLNGRLEGLIDLWKQFRELHVKLFAKCNETQRLLPYFVQDLYSTYECIYYRYYGAIHDLLNHLDSTSQSRDRKPETSIIKLPPINLPNFSGNYADWCSFRDLFTALICENSSLTGVQKLHYLKASVSGEAEQLLRSYLMSENNFIPAWESLCQRYDNRRLLVNAHLGTLLNPLQHIKETASCIRRLYDDTRESLAAIKSLRINCDHWDLPIIYIQVQRLPPDSRRSWEQAISLSTEPPTLKSYLEFLEARFRTLEAVNTSITTASASNQARTSPSGKDKDRVQTFVTRKLNCAFCNESSHLIRQCSSFLKLTTDQKWNCVKSKHLCFNCLATDHTSSKCPSKRGCSHCGQHHHTLLHRTSLNGNPTTAVTSLHARNHNDLILLSTAMIKVKSHGCAHTLRALIDTGSQASFITSEAMQRLRLKSTPVVATISGLGSTTTGNAHKMVQFVFNSGTDDKFSANIDAIVLPTLTERLPQHKFSLPHYAHLANLELADPNYNQPGNVDVILGSEIYPKIIRKGVRTGPSNSPMAQQTALGWILLGPVTQSDKNPVILSFFNKLQLDSQLRKFWEIEEPEHIPVFSEDDIICENHFATTSHRNKDGRYEVSLPFKVPSERLGSSLGQAISQLRSLERRFAKNEVFKSEYTRCLNEYVNRGYAERIPQDEIWNKPHYYMPHHGVVKETSSTTKLRIVFNASSKSDSNLSLNDILYPGPSLHQDIATVVTRWRFHRFAYSADMEKMYLQIRISEPDSNMQRFVWRLDPAFPIEHYRLKTVTFGVSSAPYLAMRSIKQLVQDEGEKFPAAVRILTDQLYVDNILSGADNVADCVRFQEEVMRILSNGGFKLRQWAANESSLLDNIPEVDHLISPTHHISGKDFPINMLGLLWNHDDDHLSIKVSLSQEESNFTKRLVLSCIAKLFDPLGWYAPVIIRAKIFMRDLWLLGLDWDQPLPEEERKIFLKLRRSLTGLDQLYVPRWIHTTTESTIELHGFCDASKSAYAAAVYIWVRSGSDTNHCSLIMAKTRVAPVEEVSIPKLELCAASLLTRLLTRILKDLDFREKPLHCWSDSTTVLAWLAKPPANWKTFVANRTSTIRQHIPNAVWRYVPSAENPADVATRGVKPEELSRNELWWKGPDWLLDSRLSWPEQAFFSTTEERRKIITLTARATWEHEVLQLTKFSSLFKLLRVTAYCIRFVDNCRRPSDRVAGCLSTSEIDRASQYWIRLIQYQFYNDDIESLKAKEDLNCKSQIKSLNPSLDKNGFLRVGGRLQNSTLTEDEKHPIILPPGHHFSKLIIANGHHQTLHGGLSMTMYHVRQKYWIPKLRSSVKAFIHQCVQCFRQLKESSKQLMGDLPKARVTPSRPFSTTGIDYAGPLSIRMSKGRNPKHYKGYIAVFVCFATKAIHLEAVSDLTTEALLAALRRFIARRGLCKQIFSDCGTNFVGAKAILDKTYINSIKTASAAASELLANDGINWNFIPPGSPHFGGLWEAGVRSVKYHLRRIVGNHTLTYEELATVLTQIEACLNSRPICPLTDNPEELNYLTPGHFLIGDALLSPPQDDLFDAKLSGLRRWQLLQKLQQIFWNKWQNEYLHRLQQRYKWQSSSRNLEVGELVIVKDERLPPLKWMMARITAVHPGNDGFVREVELKTNNSTLRRPIHKFIPDNVGLIRRIETTTILGNMEY